MPSGVPRIPGVSTAAHPSSVPPLPFGLCRNVPPSACPHTRILSPAQTLQRVLDGAELAAGFLQQQLLHRHIFLPSGDLAHPHHTGAEAAADGAECLQPPNPPLVQLENKTVTHRKHNPRAGNSAICLGPKVTCKERNHTLLCQYIHNFKLKMKLLCEILRKCFNTSGVLEIQLKEDDTPTEGQNGALCPPKSAGHECTSC